MCDVNCINWGIENIRREEVENKKICEVGSYNVNGSFRDIVESFKPFEYIGIDIEAGPGVDIICSADNLVKKFDEDRFDMVITTCVFEHIRNWKISISNIKRVTKPGGIILFVVPSRWQLHSYPYDFWRYSKDDIKNIFTDCKILKIEERRTDANHCCVFAKIKKPLEFLRQDLSNYKLFSVIANKRIINFEDKYFKHLNYKILWLKTKIKGAVYRISRFLLSR